MWRQQAQRVETVVDTTGAGESSGLVEALEPGALPFRPALLDRRQRATWRRPQQALLCLSPGAVPA